MRPSTRVRKSLLMMAVVATAGGGLAEGSGQAAAATLQSPFSTMVITAFSATGDLIAEGSQAEFDSSNAVITGSVAGDELDLTASGGTLGNTFSFDIAPPHGAVFAAGEYLSVQQTPSRQAGHPGLNITSINHSCSTDTGSFEVREIAHSGKAVSSLDLLYEQHCNGDAAALFGEIRFGEPLTGAVFVASQSITWPDVTPDTALTEVLVPVRNLSTAPVQVGSVTIVGSDPTSFVDGNDQCSGVVLAPLTGWCYVSLGFIPLGAGPQTAMLSVPLGSRTEYVQLDGTTSGDQFSLSMTSRPGDFVGQGQKYLYTPANATMALWGGPTGLAIDVNAGVGNLWTVDLYPETGAVLKPGVFANATRYPFNGSGNGLSVYGQSRGCNTVTGSFTVQQAVFSPVDAAPEHFVATFVQHCEGAAPALKGTITYGSDVTPPPVSHLATVTSARSARLTWKNPGSGSAYTVVRVQPAGALNPAPFTGTAVYSGAGNTATIGGIVKGSRYLISAFTIDVYGDVSAVTTLTFTAA
jgi:hypothetical protein